MSLILSGTNGVSDVDGTAATPAIRGTDTNTGIFFPAADTIAFAEGGVESARFDSAGNLGIGTSSPAFKLQVIGASQIQANAAGTQQVLQLNNSDISAGTQAVKLGFSSAGSTKASINAAVYGNDYMTFNVGSDTERMRIDSSGNLGLGVTPSPWVIGKVMQFGNGASILSFANIAYHNANAYFDGSWKYVANAAAGRVEISDAHKWFTAPSGTAGNAISFTQAMTLTSGGNLLVGTATTPSASTVRAVFQGTAGNDAYVQIGNGSGGGCSIGGTTGGGLAIYTYTGNVGSESYSERARIDSSGNLLVGGTSASGRGNFINPNSGDSRPLFLTNTSATATPNGSIFIDNANSGTSAWNFLQCFSNTSTSQRAFIRGDGTFGSATSTYGGVSDVRIKTDIVDTSPKLEKLMQVRVVNYTRVDDASQSRELGVIAQELEQVFPGLVYESEIKDADGKVLCPDRKNVKYSVFVPMLIKAIQEQQAIITELTTRIAALEAK